MLTLSQNKTLTFIKDFVAKYSYAPTMAEIAKGIGIKSRGVVHRYVHALEEHGLIHLVPGRHRNIQLLEDDDSDGGGGQVHQEMSLPLLGCIAAGRPIEAIAHQERLDLSGLMLGDNRYALQVKGDSMIEEGIFDGDIVICEHSQTARNGEIVVALIDNQEATLKRLQRNPDNSITLIPANARLSPMVYEASRVMVQGIFIGLLRLSRR